MKSKISSATNSGIKRRLLASWQKTQDSHLNLKVKRYIVRTMVYAILFSLAFIFIYPFLYMVVTSVKTNADLNNVTVNWVPTSLYFKNYKYAYEILTYEKHFKNSLLITVVATAGHMLSCAFIGYGLARYKLLGGKLVFFIVILTIIIPVQTLIVPSYLVYTNLKWIDSYLPVLVPTFFGYGLKGPLFIYLFRQFYLGVPKDLENAAKIDGSGYLQTYFRIVMPTAQSAFLVTLLLSIVWHWNDFYEVDIYTSSLSLVTLPAKLNFLVAFVSNPDDNTFHVSSLFDAMKSLDRQGVINNAVLMAGNLLVMLPVIICFVFLQKKFMQGIERTGLVE